MLAVSPWGQADIWHGISQHASVDGSPGNQWKLCLHLCFTTLTFRKKTLHCFFYLSTTADPAVTERNLTRTVWRWGSRLECGGQDGWRWAHPSMCRTPGRSKGTCPANHQLFEGSIPFSFTCFSLILIKYKVLVGRDQLILTLAPLIYGARRGGVVITPCYYTLSSQTFTCTAGTSDLEEAESDLVARSDLMWYLADKNPEGVGIAGSGHTEWKRGVVVTVTGPQNRQWPTSNDFPISGSESLRQLYEHSFYPPTKQQRSIIVSDCYFWPRVPSFACRCHE